MEELEYRYAPVQLNGRVLSGTVMRYGEVSEGIVQPERFLPGSLEFSDVILNVQHERNRPIARTPETLVLTDSRESLEMRAEVPETREGTDAVELVRKSILRGLSVEFRAIRERYEGGIRVIERALLSGIGLVDKPAYLGSTVEARAITGVSMTSTVQYNSRLQCECCPDADTVSIEPRAFDHIFAPDQARNILAVSGNYRNALSSLSRGSLRLRNTPEGLILETTLADTQAGRDLLALAADAPIYARPILDFGKSVYEVIEGVAVVRTAHLRAFLLGSTDANAGWAPMRIVRAQENRREHIWL